MLRSLMAAGVFVFASAVGTAAPAVTEIYEKAIPAVTWVLSETEEGHIQGTAWVVDAKNRLLVTNHHVAGDASGIELYFPQNRAGRLMTSRSWYQRNGTAVAAKVVVTNPKKDLAVIQVDELPEGARQLPLAADSPAVGDTIYTVGHPGNNTKLWAGNSGKVQLVGVRKTRLENGQVFDGKIHRSALPIYKGASGSPVVNDGGRVVGVVFSGNLNGPETTVYCVDVSEVRAMVVTAHKKLKVASPPGFEPTLEDGSRAALAA